MLSLQRGVRAPLATFSSAPIGNSRGRGDPAQHFRYSMHHRGRRTPFEPRKIHPLQLPVNTTGFTLLKDPFYNKGTAFPNRERDRLGLRGLLPPAHIPIELQLQRVYEAYRRTGIHHMGKGEGANENKLAEMVAKHIFLCNLQDRNETLFYKLIVEHITEMAPIIYTPTVGYACLNASMLFRQARGLYFSGFADRGDYHSIIRNWPAEDVDVIVITDGSRILGLGDLGVHGMPIPVGKLSLYVAAGGIDPTKCLPIMVDMGTNNPACLEDELYLGTKERRLEGEVYFEVMDQVMDAIVERFPNAVIQFEDFKTPYAEALLNRYRKKCTMFNDDIQGTGTMCLAGIMSALKIKARSLIQSEADGRQHPESQLFKLPEGNLQAEPAPAAAVPAAPRNNRSANINEILAEAFEAEDLIEEDELYLEQDRSEEVPTAARFREQRVVCLGAGSAGLGVSAKLHQGMVMDGLSKQQAYDRIFLVDKNGLLTSDRQLLEPGQKRYASKSYQVEGLGLKEGSSLLDVVRAVKPTILLGVSGVGGTFTQEILEEMSKHVDRPIIFSMSNPTDRSECTAEQAYEYTNGRAIFASGSPFSDVVRDGKTVMSVSQANNMYVFPGIGLGAVVSRSKTITAEMLYVAAVLLSDSVSEEDLARGKIFPPLAQIRSVSKRIAVGVAKEADAQNLARQFPGDDETWEDFVEDSMWKPVYRHLVRA